jgi:hypothetical protein
VTLHLHLTLPTHLTSPHLTSALWCDAVGVLRVHLEEDVKYEESYILAVSN